jgi:uncharacterized protein YciI
MNTATTFDLRGFTRAAEQRDAATQLSMYAPTATVTIVDRTPQPAAPRALHGQDEIRLWLEDTCARDMTHAVQRAVADAHGAAFTEFGRKVRGVYFAVRLERGGPWEWSRDLRQQDGFDEHARFMDSLLDDGFIVVGGPLEDEREILHLIDAPSKDAVRERLAEDNWHQNGMLTILSIDAWTLLLDGR